jgi:hypothetical protein
MTGFRLSASTEAEVRLLPPDERGRRSPVASGYRCNCWVGHTDDDGHRIYNDAVFHLIYDDRLAPGATARARVEPHFPDDWSHLTAGSSFELREGPRAIGSRDRDRLVPADMKPIMYALLWQAWPVQLTAPTVDLPYALRQTKERVRRGRCCSSSGLRY